jgi:hypothetical protein
MRTTVNRNRNKTYSSRLLRVLVAIALFTVFMHLLLQYLNLEVFYQQNAHAYELSNRFDMDDEASVPTWISQAIFLIIGSGALLAAYLQSDKPSRRIWQMLAAVGLLFSLDETTTMHEYILQSLHVLFFQDASPTAFANAWWLVAPFILFAGGWLTWKIWQLLPRRTALLFLLAGAVFLTGAVFVDLLTSVVPRETFLNQGILVALEESLELSGSLIALYSIADYLETYHLAALSNSIKQLRPSRSQP